MGGLFGQIGSLLAAPGNLIYQLVLAFSVAGALQAAFLRWRKSGATQDRRAMLGLGVMLAALVSYFLLGMAVALLYPAAAVILPSLDRALTLILLIWPIWIWVFPEPSRQPDLGVLIVNGLAVMAAAVGLLLGGSSAAEGGFNQGPANILWQLATLALLVLGAALLYIRRTDGFANEMAFVILAFLGHIVHLIIREAGDYSGVVRLAHIAAVPLLLTLSQRRAAQSAQTPEVLEGVELPVAEPRRYGADPKTLHALLGLAGQTDPTGILDLRL